MALCFQLFDKDGNSPTMQKLDEEICKLFNKPVDPKYYCPLYEWTSSEGYYQALNWYDTVGLALAQGNGYDDIRKLWPDWQEALKLIDYLESKYTPRAFYQPK